MSNEQGLAPSLSGHVRFLGEYPGKLLAFDSFDDQRRRVSYQERLHYMFVSPAASNPSNPSTTSPTKCSAPQNTRSPFRSTRTSCAIGIHSAAFAAQEKHPLGHKTKYGGWHPPHFTEDIAMGMLVDRLTRTGSKHLLELNLPCQAPM